MIELYTAPTPNGWKVSIALEEMEIPYRLRTVDLYALEHREEWFLALNPNGKIPVIVDGDLVLAESGAILLYLAEKSGRLLPQDRHEHWACMQWLMFQMSAVGPMMGQANVFARYAPERIAWAIDRYQREGRRLFEVLDRRLAAAPYLAGSTYSIADIANYAWVFTHKWSGIEVEGLPHLQRWMTELWHRPAVYRGKKSPAAPKDRTSVDIGGRKLL